MPSKSKLGSSGMDLVNEIGGVAEAEQERPAKKSSAKTTSTTKLKPATVYTSPEVREALDRVVFSRRNEAPKPSISSIILEGLELWFQKNHKCGLSDIDEGKTSFDL